MKDLLRVTVPLYLITFGIIVIVLQNAGIISPHKPPQIVVTSPVSIDGEVDVRGTVEIDNTVDVNLAEVVGTGLVHSQAGMYIGVSSTKNTIIPINWGEISITK